MSRLADRSWKQRGGRECARGFEHRQWHRNVPAGELLADLRRAAKLAGTGTVTCTAYERHGRFSRRTISGRFGSWNAALRRAGMEPSRFVKVTKEDLAKDIRRVARKMRRRSLLLREYLEDGRYCAMVVYRSFSSWRDAVAAAGLRAGKIHHHTTQELLEEIGRVWRKLGRQPKYDEMKRPIARCCASVFHTRFGGFHKALAAFVKWEKSGRRGMAMTSDRTRRRGIGGIVKQDRRRMIGWRLRFLTLRRDGFRCRACGRSPATEAGVKLQVDHVMPWSKGGKTGMGNLQTLCRECNCGKSNLDWKIKGPRSAMRGRSDVNL